MNKGQKKTNTKSNRNVKAAKEAEMKERYPMTIPQELFDAWQLLRRVGDGVTIPRKIKKCRPIVDRALNYGHVKDDKVIEKINKFFEDRIAQEKKKAAELIELALQD